MDGPGGQGRTRSTDNVERVCVCVCVPLSASQFSESRLADDAGFTTTDMDT